MSASAQKPVNSPFNAKTSALDALHDIDLSGKNVIVTGGYSGLGLEVTRALASKGARVVVPVRTPEKAKETLANVDGDIVTGKVDLADLSTVTSFANAMTTQMEQLDILINNAGIMACPETRVGPGWEAQFGVNHMGHFALTCALLPLLRKSKAARVVSLSSTGHKISDVLWDDIHFNKTPYEKWQAYGQAKTANALFANALSRRMKDFGGLAFAVHPGGIFTPLQRHLPKEEMITLGWLGEDGEPSAAAKAGFKTPEQGASTTVWAATSHLLEEMPGVYCEDCNVAEPADPSSPHARYRGVNEHACSDESAERLWTISEKLLEEA